MAVPALTPDNDVFHTMWQRAMQPLADPASGVEVHVEGDGSDVPTPDENGAITIPTDDGGVIIQFPDMFGGNEDRTGNDHDANLADLLSAGERSIIADDLLQGIEQDDKDRAKYLQNRAKGIDHLALSLDPPRNDTTASSGSMEGMSSIRNPLLLEAVLRFQANARGELLPAAGPVKVRNDGTQVDLTDAQANALEKDLNTYLTVTAPEYYPDTDRMLFMVGFGGVGFKKIYHCPLRRRPVSESIDAKDLIVPNNATDLRNAARITHQIQMRPNVMRRMQLLGVYRDVELGQPMNHTQNPVTQKTSMVTGQSPNTMRPQDQDYTLYETLCELDLPGFENVDEDGYQTGLKLPYKVTFDRDSKEILEIRRNWDQDDETQTAKRVFVKYPFIPGLGFYDIGLLNVLGNASAALTAAWRICLDNGMFSNFPGGVYSKQGVGRQLTNEFRVAPGGLVGLDVGGQDIRQALMPLPYKELGPVFTAFIQEVQQTLQRVGGTAEMNVGEGRSDAPVGTTIALIEQAKIVMDAVHKRLHAAQAEEFQLLKERFREDPEAFWRHNKSPQFPQDRDLLLAALESYELIPVADPNVPSSMHRHAKIAALMQLVQMHGELFDIPVVLNMILRDMKFDDPTALLAKGPPPPPPPDPKLAVAQIKANTDMQKALSQAQQAAEDRKSRESLELLRIAQSEVIHPNSAPLAANPVVPQQIYQQ